MHTATPSSEFERYQAEEKVRKDRNRDAQRKYRISVKRRLSESTKLQERIAELERLIAFLQTRPNEHEIESIASPCNPLVESQDRSSTATAGTNVLGEICYHKPLDLLSKEHSPVSNKDEDILAQITELQCSNGLLQDDADGAIPCVGMELDLERTKVDEPSLAGRARTAISAAAESGNIEMVKVLIDHGANIMAVDGSGTTAIHKAFEGGHFEAATFLLRHAPAGAANQTDIFGRTVLGIAIENNHVELARLALRHGANVDYI